MIDINFQPSKKELRTFSALLWPFLSFVGWMVWRKTGSMPTAVGLSAAGLVLGALGLAIPKLMRPLFVGMQIAGFPIGWVVSHVVVAVIFYLVVTPIGVIMRLTGRDPMQRKFDRGAKTYWKPRSGGSPSSRYFRQF